MITATTTSDASNGRVTSVGDLLASPGRDGISLREAIEAANNDPGEYTIRFASALRGKSILVREFLPPLTGGNLTIEGQGVTLRAPDRHEELWGLMVASSGNRLRALTLEGFDIGVLIQPWRPGRGLLTHVILADNVLSDLVMRRIGDAGIAVRSMWSPGCGVPNPRPCRSFSRILDTTITGNTIEARQAGIKLGLNNSGDRLERVTVTSNEIRISENTDMGIGLEMGGNAGDDGTPARISDVLIAHNRVEGAAGAGISVSAGVHRAQGNVTQRVRVLNNRVHLVRRGEGFCCKGVWVFAGGEASDGIFPEVRPLRYPDRNVVRGVEVRGNVVSGTLEWGVGVSTASQAPGSGNRAEDVRVVGNTIRSIVARGRGVFVFTDSNGEPPGGTYAVGNRIARVRIASNRITAPGRPTSYRPATAGAIVLLAGGEWSRDGSIRDVTIANNRIATSEVGIKVVGGIGGNARGNSVTCVRISANRVRGARASISVISNAEYASGNRASLAGC